MKVNLKPIEHETEVYIWCRNIQSCPDSRIRRFAIPTGRLSHGLTCISVADVLQQTYLWIKTSMGIPTDQCQEGWKSRVENWAHSAHVRTQCDFKLNLEQRAFDLWKIWKLSQSLRLQTHNKVRKTSVNISREKDSKRLARSRFYSPLIFILWSFIL